MPTPISESANRIDLSPRIVDTTAVAASPATAAETVIATVNIPNFGDTVVTQKIYLEGWAALTVGTSGTTCNLRIRQSSVSGSVVATTGTTTVTAANLIETSVRGSDATPGVGTYVLTAQIGAAAAASTVSAVQLLATIV